MRRLEVRIGVVLGPASPNGKGLGSIATDPDGLSKDERHAFRTMAVHADVVAFTSVRVQAFCLRASIVRKSEAFETARA